MKIISKLILLTSASLLSQGALAASCAQTGNVIGGLVGVDSSGTPAQIYVGITQSNNECGCTFVRFQPTNADTKKVLSVVTAAKLSGKKVRLDILDLPDCNSGYKAFIE